MSQAILTGRLEKYILRKKMEKITQKRMKILDVRRCWNKASLVRCIVSFIIFKYVQETTVTTMCFFLLFLVILVQDN